MKNLRNYEILIFYMHDGIILAAGYGTRLLPITKVIPKPLIPIFNKPIIIFVMERMWNYGIKNFFINVHYKKDEIIQTVKHSPFRGSTEFQIEDDLLLTGGGLCGLLSKAHAESVLVHNVDIVDEFDYERLWSIHKKEQNDITWILTKERGNVLIEGNRIIGFGENGMTYAGVGVYNRKVIELMPEGKFSLLVWLIEMIRERKVKVGYVIEEGFWQDTGTPYGIFNTYVHIFERIGKNLEIEGKVKGNVLFSGYVYVGKEVEINGNGAIRDSIVLGKTSFWGNINIERRIIYDGLYATF